MRNCGALPGYGIGRLTRKVAAMGPDDLIRACLDEMRVSEEMAAAGLVAGAYRSPLLGTEGVAAVLAGYTIGEHGANRDRSRELFEALIGAALRDQKGAGRLGTRFLDEAARTIRLLAGTDRLDAPATHDLARAYARAGAEAPPELVQCLAEHMAELRKAGTLPVDPDSEIERMSVVLDLDPHYLHRKLEERIGVFPEEARAAFAYEVACRDEAACGRIAMYWLLDESAEVRLGAGDGFRERAQRGIVDPVSAALVPLIRNWMPADSGRTLLDEALAKARRREQVAPLPPPEWRRAEIYGSIPDMWGTQMLRVVLQGREEPAVATVVTEPGRGIAQAIVISGMEAIGELAGSESFDALIETPWETFEEQVAVALAEGLAAERPPAAGLIDVALACGMWELRPRAMTPGDWLSELDPNDKIAALPAPVREELIGGSAAWRDDYVVVKGWSEGTAVLQEAMEEAGDADGVKAGFFARLEPRREDWALRMLRSAHVLKGAGKVDWKTFAGTAEGRAGRPGAGDHPHHGVCLGEDQQGPGERGIATRASVSGWTS